MNRSMIAIFVAGILVGWIAEWLFYIFFIKKSSSTTTQNEGPAESVADDQHSTSEGVDNDKKDNDKKDASEGEEDEEDGKNNGKNNKSATDSTGGSDDTDNVETIDQTIDQRSDTSDSSEKEPVNTESTTDDSEKSVDDEDDDSKNSQESDDLRVLKGIGPKLAKSLTAVGITTFTQLAELSGEAISTLLEESGHSVINKPALDNLAPQAKLAAKGDFDGLEILQKSI